MQFFKSIEKRVPFSFLIVALAFVGALALGWFLQTPTKEELFGDTGKIFDVFKNGINSWNPNYLLGGSSLLLQSSGLALSVIAFLNLLLGSIVDLFAVMKIAIVLFVLLSGWSMFFLVRHLTKSKEQASLAALAYMMMPSLLVAIGIYEHWTVGLCFVFVPLILRGILVVAEKESPREVLLLGLSAAAITLSYTKIAVVISPVLFLWTLEVLRLHPENRRKIFIRYAASAGTALLLALAFLLPASREFGFAAGFLMDPLDAWQHHYSFKSALQWIDVWGIFMKGGGPNVEVDGAMFAIGLVPLAAISLGLGLPALREWRHSSTGRWFLILVACWLVSTGFAAGPDGILLGHWHLLKEARGMANLSIPLLWLALLWLIWMTYETVHQLIGGRTWRALVVVAFFLTCPLFCLVKVLPLFKDIRALESFWSVGGFCALAAAVGIVTVVLFVEVVPKRFLRITALILALLFFAELYPIHSVYWTRGLPTELFEQYDQALAFLKNAPLQGRVHPVCSRYFYLTIPKETDRGVSTESLLKHFQLKWVRYLEVAGNANSDAMKSYLNIAGVAYILIDKEDPMTPPQVQNFYRSLYPLVFENQYFAILENRTSLYPAFLARNFITFPEENYMMAIASLQLAPMNLLAVELPQVDQSQIGFAGMAKGENQVELLPSYRGHGGVPFQRMELVGKRSDNYQQMIYDVSPATSGWLTVTEAFHPDWKVTIDGQPAQVRRAEAALLSVYVPLGSRQIVFQFKAPLWYSLSFYIGIMSWVVALGALGFLSSRWACPKWKEWWVKS